MPVNQVPVDLVIDHSVQVDVTRSANALRANQEFEFSRNNERFAFLKWGATAFENMLVVPPGSGIVHQVCIDTLLGISDNMCTLTLRATYEMLKLVMITGEFGVFGSCGVQPRWSPLP